MKKIAEQEIIAKGKAHFLCMDCGLDTDKAEQYYMLHKRIWRSIHHQMWTCCAWIVWSAD